MANHSSEERTPVPLWIYVASGLLIATLVFIVVNSRSRHDGNAQWVSPVAQTEKQEPLPIPQPISDAERDAVLPVTNGIKWPRPDCYDGYGDEPDGHDDELWWVVGWKGGVKGSKVMHMRAGEFVDKVVAASPAELKQLPDAEFYCPPDTKFGS